MNEYTRQSQAGREAASLDIASGDLFRLIARMRELAADDSGFGAGYLSAIAQRATD